MKIKKTFVPLFYLLIMLKISNVMAYETKDDNCFIVKEGDKIIAIEGSKCKERTSPCSTFKIAISLMGYDSNILIDENNPILPFDSSYKDPMEIWKQSYYPSIWMKNSCVWYSQKITTMLGNKRFSHYINLFDYGNKDVSGDYKQNNGLTNSWLSSSLKISPMEQINFIEKLVRNDLGLSDKATIMTKNILFVDDVGNGWKLYGKTGSCNIKKEDNLTKNGWFVGWIEKDSTKIIFANYIIDKNKDYTSGRKAKEMAIKKLEQLGLTK